MPPKKGMLTKVNSFDEETTVCGANLLAGSESMDVSNDPRFFAKNVMDKRLAAFKSLTIVSGLMFGTSMKLTFELKQDLQFSDTQKYVGNIALWQGLGFVLSVIVASMCLVSLYVIAHQLFYTYRLMTAGPTGFEQASVFYLTRTITVWRHIAIKCLFNGLWAFMVLVGVQLFVKFYKDADSEKGGPHEVWVLNMLNGTAVDHTVVDLVAHHKVNMTRHTILGYIVFAGILCLCAVLAWVRSVHLKVFHDNYQTIKEMTDPIQANLARMAHRATDEFHLTGARFSPR